MYAQSIHKQVEKQKKDAQKKFTSWLFDKFKSNKKQYIREQEERVVEAERRRRLKQPSAKLEAQSPTEQRQKSFLRSQLLEMKRQSQEVLASTKKKRDGSSDNAQTSDDDEQGQQDEGDCDATPIENKKEVEEEEQQEEKDNQEDDLHKEDEHDKDEEDKPPVEEEGNQREDAEDESSARTSTGGHRNSISEELDRRMTHATLLYAEAISALDELLQPDTVEPVTTHRPSQVVARSTYVPTRTTRAPSVAKNVFARPDSAWI